MEIKDKQNQIDVIKVLFNGRVELPEKRINKQEEIQNEIHWIKNFDPEDVSRIEKTIAAFQGILGHIREIEGIIKESPLNLSC